MCGRAALLRHTASGMEGYTAKLDVIPLDQSWITSPTIKINCSVSCCSRMTRRPSTDTLQSANGTSPCMPAAAPTHAAAVVIFETRTSSPPVTQEAPRCDILTKQALPGSTALGTLRRGLKWHACHAHMSTRTLSHHQSRQPRRLTTRSASDAAEPRQREILDSVAGRGEAVVRPSACSEECCPRSSTPPTKAAAVLPATYRHHATRGITYYHVLHRIVPQVAITRGSGKNVNQPGTHAGATAALRCFT